MPRAVANTLLPAARPASTIARPRPRELPVTNHTCAIHPPVSKPTTQRYSGKASQTQDRMRDAYRNASAEGIWNWVSRLPEDPSTPAPSRVKDHERRLNE